MGKLVPLILIFSYINIITTDIIDYTRENYILVEEEDAGIFEYYGSLYHLTNLSLFENVVNKYKSNEEIILIDNSSMDYEIRMIETLLGQLKVDNKRSKRGINELGTVWKWISGTPDHDDFMKITNKVNDLIENNNKQFTTNSQIFKTITELTQILKQLQGSSNEKTVLRQRNKLIITELENIVETITLSKVGILNPLILDMSEIKEIISNEQVNVTISDLIDVSEFKIVQKSNLIVVYIKYPKVKNVCKLYKAIAVAQNDGKLLIENEIIKCGDKFYSVKFCKKELNNAFCMIKGNNTCLSNMLNNKHANCTKINEANESINIVKDGAIIASGKHKINNHTIEGVYLITFQDDVIIDNRKYENPTGKILGYLREGKLKSFFVNKYIETKNIDLKLNNVNILTPFKQEIKRNPVWWTFTTLIVIILSAYFVFKFIIYINLKIKLKNAKEKEELLLQLSDRINHLTALYSKTGRFDLEEGELTPPIPHTTNPRCKQLSID